MGSWCRDDQLWQFAGGMDDLTSLTGGCRAPVLRMHSDKAKEFLAKSVRSLLKAHGIRQTTNSDTTLLPMASLNVGLGS